MHRKEDVQGEGVTNREGVRRSKNGGVMLTLVRPKRKTNIAFHKSSVASALDAEEEKRLPAWMNDRSLLPKKPPNWRNPRDGSTDPQ